MYAACSRRQDAGAPQIFTMRVAAESHAADFTVYSGN